MTGARHAGSHRAAPAPHLLRLGLALLGVSAVAVLVAVALHSSPKLSDRSGAGVAVTFAPAPTTAASQEATAAPEETGAEPTSAPSSEATPALSEGPPTASPSAAGGADAQAPKLALLVLNNSRIDNLAARAAADFRAGGWPVRGTGNFRGRVAVTTVYYAAGQEQSARRLAEQFPKVRRVAPRFAGLPGSGLTVVVTRDYAGQ